MPEDPSIEEITTSKFVDGELWEELTGKGELAESDVAPIEVVLIFGSEDGLDEFWNRLVGVVGLSSDEVVDTDVLQNLTTSALIQALSVEPAALAKALSEATVEEADLSAQARGVLHKEKVKEMVIPETQKVPFNELSSVTTTMTAADIRALEFMLRSSPDIQTKLPITRIERSELFEEFVDQSAEQIGVNPGLRSLGLDGSGIKVAVIDSGVDRTHEDFKDRVVDYKDFTEGNFKDDSGHGSHVAGTILGTGVASNGRLSGMAPGASLYAVKVLYQGKGNTARIVNGVKYAISQSVDVINMSLGSLRPNNGKDLISMVVNQAVTKYGIVVCVAAGNSGRSGPKTIGSPGAVQQAITVGAVNNKDEVAAFSSRGPVAVSLNPADLSNIKPDVLAPGVDIAAPRASETASGSPTYRTKSDLPPNLQGKYTYKSGTSMATPVCSGVCALMLQAYRNSKGARDEQKWNLIKTQKDEQGINLAQRIKRILMETAKKLPGEDVYAQGQGRIQAIEAVSRLVPGFVPVLVTPPVFGGEQPYISGRGHLDILSIITRLRQDNLRGLPFLKRRKLERQRKQVMQQLVYLAELRERTAGVQTGLIDSVEDSFGQLIEHLLSQYEAGKA